MKVLAAANGMAAVTPREGTLPVGATLLRCCPPPGARWWARSPPTGRRYHGEIPGSSANPPPRIASLDGLRGTAIVGVILFHADVIVGGWLGVDLFFVLSGFLITSLMLGEYRRSGGVALGAFWARRARRLLPALLVLLLFAVGYSLVWGRTGEAAGLRREGVASLFFVGNWAQILASDAYWDQFRQPSILRHLWSLGVEEQLYLLWPPVLVLGLKRLPRPRLVTVVGVGVAALAAWPIIAFALGMSGNRVYLGTDTRAVSMMAGAALAFHAQPFAAGVRRRCGDPLVRRNWGIAQVVALAVLVVMWLALDGLNPLCWRGAVSVAVAAECVLVVCAAAEVGPFAAALRFAPLRYLGRVSYGLYLWHWPVFQLLSPERLGWGRWPSLALALSVSLIVAELSHRFLELPIQRASWSPRSVAVRLGPAVGVVAVLLTVGIREPSQPSVDPVSLLGPPISAPVDAGGSVTSGGKPLRVLVVGDSVAEGIGKALRGRAAHDPTLEVRNEAMIACPFRTAPDGWVDEFGTVHPDRPECSRYRERWRRAVAEFHPDIALVVRGGADGRRRGSDGVVLDECTPAYDALWQRELDTALRSLVGVKGLRVGVATMGTQESFEGVETPSAARVAGCLNPVLKGASERVKGVVIVDLAEWVCPDGKCRSSIRGVELRPDGIHYSPIAAEAAGLWMIRELTGRPPTG